jgi:hypothetical protein
LVLAGIITYSIILFLIGGLNKRDLGILKFLFNRR